MTFTQWHRNHSCDYGTDDYATGVYASGAKSLWVQDCGYKMGIDVALSDWLKQLSIQ